MIKHNIGLTKTSGMQKGIDRSIIMVSVVEIVCCKPASG